MENNFKIQKRSGEIDIEIPDGKYKVNADITLENGMIKFIDNGIWTPLDQKVFKKQNINKEVK